jgi:hypothetical protein
MGSFIICKNSVHAHLFVWLDFQIVKKWYPYRWAWRGCDMLQTVWMLQICPLSYRKGKAWNSWALTQLGHPVNLPRCNFHKPLFTSTSKCYYFLSKQMYFYEHVRGIIRHTFHNVFSTSWTLYLSQYVSQGCQQTAAESRSHCTEVTLQNHKH